MRGDYRTMKVLRPSNAAQALRLFGRSPDALPLAGGTDVMVSWNMGHLNGRVVLDLSRLAEWRRVRATAEGALIGSLVTHAAIQRHPALRRSFPLLIEACATVGAAQIQNRGTLGGNIANASPAADTFPPLAVYGAKVHAASTSGQRVLPFAEVFAGVKKTTLGPGELIEAVELPVPFPPPDRQFFRKVGSRLAQTISKTMGAGLLWFNTNGTVRELRLAFGSVAPTVRRLPSVEAYAAGKRLTPDIVEECAQLAAQDISPIDDIRSTRQYRLVVTQNLVRRFLQGSHY